jgi:hypothetical protein
MSSELPEDSAGILNFIAVSVQEMSERLGRVEAGMVTKGDLARAETTIRGDLEQVHLRLDTIEKALTARMSDLEAELSRLRSAV